MKLLKDLLEVPFQMCYLPGKSELISSVDTLSRALVSPVSELGPDPLDSVYHPRNRDGSKSHEFCFLASGGGMASEWCSEDPALAPLYKAAAEDKSIWTFVMPLSRVKRAGASSGTCHANLKHSNSSMSTEFRETHKGAA